MTDERPPGPRRIGKFEILRHLAKGGMGQVWLARNPDTEQLVAIKETLLADPGLEERLHKEATTLAQLEHPYILPIYDEIREGDKIYVVTRYVGGGTLDDKVADGQTAPSQEDLLRWADQTLDALAAAHGKGVLHRDIKPSNIFLSDKGDVLVGDFGLARDLDATMSMGVAGTVPFMSPEQLSGKGLDGRSDLFALGATLFVVATGELPYAGASRETPPPSLREQRPDLSEACTSFVDSMLRAEADTRPESATAAREILAGIRSAPSLETRRKRRIVRIGGTLLALLAAVFLAGELGQIIERIVGGCDPLAPTEERVRRLAILPLESTGDAYAVELAEQLHEQLARAFDGVGDVVVVPQESLVCIAENLEGQTLDTKRLERLPAEIGAELVMGGTVSLSGGRIQAQLLIADASSGEVTHVEGPIGDLGGVLAYGEMLALRSVPELFPGPPHELSRVAASVANGWPAARAYINGQQARRRQKWDAWKEGFEICLEQDSTMALAHLGLGSWCGWNGDEALREHHLRRAVELSGNLPLKIQDLVRAIHAESTLQVDEGEALYASVLARDPNCVEAWYQVASLRYHHNPYRGRDTIESREAFERATELDPDFVLPWTLLRFVIPATGDYDTLAELFHDWSGGRLGPMARGILAYQRNDPEEQAVYADSMRLERLSYAWPMVLVFLDNHHNDERFLEEVHRRVEPGVQQGWARESLAHVLIGMGRWEEASRHFADMPDRLRPWQLSYQSIAMAMPFTRATEGEIRDQITKLRSWRAQDDAPLADPAAEDLLEQRYAPDLGLNQYMRAYSLGLLHCRLGEVALATEVLNDMEALPVPIDQEAICEELERTVHAWIVRHEDGPEEALKILEPASRAYLENQVYSGVQERGPQRWLRAQWLVEVGRGEEALGWFAGLHERTERQLMYSADAHYQRAKIHENAGRQERAREHYETFLHLYQNADPRYADLVENARSKLARPGS